MISSSTNNTRRKHQQDNPDLHIHASGMDPFSFLVRKRKDCPNSSNLVTTKTKQVQFLGAPDAGSQSSILLDAINGDVDDVALDTTNHDINNLFSDLLNYTNTNAVTDHNHIRCPLLIPSLVPMKESELPFDLEGPLPQNCQFQLDLLNILS
jgi:hypothetical protein